MAQPFLSLGAYKGLTVFGILLTILFAVALYFALLKIQRFRVEKKLRELSGDKNRTVHDEWSKRQLLMKVHVPAFAYVVAFFLIGLFFVTFTTSAWAILAGLVLVGFMSCYNRQTYGKLDWSKGEPMLYVYGVIACIFFLYTSMSLTHTSIQMQEYAHYTYKGPMQVVGLDYYLNGDFYTDEYASWCEHDYYDFYDDEYASCPVEMNMAVIQVTWTCPETECSAEVNTNFCNALVCTATDASCTLECSDDDWQAAQYETMTCLGEKYNETSIQLNAGNDDDDNQNNGDDNQNDDADGDWSYDNMYGDCESCSAEYVNVVDGNRFVSNSYGYGTTLFFFVVAVLAGAAWMYTRYSLASSQKDSKNEELIANEKAVAT